jgi:hypothetical protein
MRYIIGYPKWREMDENKEEIQKSISMMCQDLDERLPKGDIKMQGTNENKGSSHFQLVNLTLIVELIMLAVPNLTFPILN